jgi:hypothetical protein
MDVRIGSSAAAVGVRWNGGEKFASIRFLARAPNDNERRCEHRSNVGNLTGLFCLQDTLIQVCNLTLDAQANMVCMRVVRKATVIVGPAGDTICHGEVNEGRLRKSAVSMPNAGRNEHLRAFANRHGRSILILEKSFSVGRQQHLFAGVVVPLRICSIDKLHKLAAQRR